MQAPEDPPSVKAAQDYLDARAELGRAVVRVESARARYDAERETLAAWHQQTHEKRVALEAALDRESAHNLPANDVEATP